MSFRNETRISMDVREEAPPSEVLATSVDLAFEEMHPSHLQRRDGNTEFSSGGRIPDMERIRETIMEHERVFREQVRELHRVHRVQTILMGEMRNKEKERDFASRSLLSNMGIHSLSPTFPVNSKRWDRVGGDLFGGKCCDTSLVMPESMKSNEYLAQSEASFSRHAQEESLLKRKLQIAPTRKSFDLERPPEDEDDEQMDCRYDESSGQDESSIRFMGSPAVARSEVECEISLSVNPGWTQSNAVKDDKVSLTKVDPEMKSSKRAREEAPLIPFLDAKSENLRDALSCRSTTATPSSAFLGGGVWGLHLGRKTDSPSSADGISSADDGEVFKKKELGSLKLELGEKLAPGSPSNCAPHWRKKAPAANGANESVCQTARASLSFQHSVSPPRDRSEHRMIKPATFLSVTESVPDLTPDLAWPGDRRTSDTPAGLPSHWSSTRRRMSEEEVYQAPVTSLGCVGAGGVIGPPKISLKAENVSGNLSPGHSPWNERGDISCRSFSYKFGSSHPNSATIGPLTKDCDLYRGLPAPGVVNIGPAVNIGLGSAASSADHNSSVWNQRKVEDSQVHQYNEQREKFSPHNERIPSLQRPWEAPMQISQRATPSGPGALYVQNTPVSTILRVSDRLQMFENSLPGAHWNRENEPPFAPISTVAPSKSPFKRPPKILLTHDGMTTDLELVSPFTQLSAKVVEKTISGISIEDLPQRGGRRSNEYVDHGRVEDGSDVTLHTGGRSECDAATGVYGGLKDKRTGADAGSWMLTKSRPPGRESEILRARGESGLHRYSLGAVRTDSHEGMDDADRGSSDGGSGGYGVGDVINPGDRGSPSLGTLSIGESNRYLPAGEGEEGVNMGEIGLEADSESQSSVDGKAVQVKKPRRHHEDVDSQEALFTSANRSSHPSVTTMMIGREVADKPSFSFEKRTLGRDAASSPDEENRRPVAFHHYFDQSCTSGPMTGYRETGNRLLGLFADRQGPVEFRMTHLEHDQSFGSPRAVHASKTIGRHVKEGSDFTALFPQNRGTKLMRELQGGRAPMDVEDMGSEHAKEHRNLVASDFIDVCKEERDFKILRSKQLSGPIVIEKDVQRKPYSSVLRQIPSPSSTVNLARHVEGSSLNVSQASETVQGNGRALLRGSRWIGPVPMEQDRCYYPGAISTCEKREGSPVKGFQQGNLYGKDLTLGRMYVPSTMQKELNRTTSAMVVTNLSTYGSKGISASAKAPQHAKDAGM